MLDIFNDNAFSAVSLTARINNRAFKPTFVRKSGLFVASGISTTSVAIEANGDTLALVQTTKRGAPAVQHKTGKRAVYSLIAPRIALEDRVGADEIQNVRAYGVENELVGATAVIDGRFGEMADNVDLTLENMLLTALQGKVADADGSVLVDLYAVFGVQAEAEIDFKLNVATTDVKGVIAKLIRKMKTNLGASAAFMTGVEALCSGTFFDELVGHAKVEKAYEMQSMLREGQVHRFVDYGGIRFWDYEGSGDVAIAEGKARFYPLGTGLGKLHYAPADTISAANTVGLPLYAMQAPDHRFNQFVDLHLQSNPLPIFLKPKALMSAKAH
jgi:hypothetical protein